MEVWKLRNAFGHHRLKSLAKRYWNDALVLQDLAATEESKSTRKTEIINYDLINCANKASVDPGVEFEPNPVDFPMTSDAFFTHWKHAIRTPYDVIFIDGLHRAEQVRRDISHAVEMTTSNGLIILHDCNPPHHELARESYDSDGVAGEIWNGTTWKAVWEFFFHGPFELRVIDTDWGVGIVDKSKPKIPQTVRNSFFEFDAFSSTKHEAGYLVSWKDAKAWLAIGS